MDVHSERTGTSMVLTNSEFVVRKLTFSRCHGRHLLNSGTGEGGYPFFRLFSDMWQFWSGSGKTCLQ
ncbi:hypothetical protein [Treponema sp. OMZ 857]|uniref:hypothetical protein n=1 Tax=Treponema sp. OMZ 857 TaxID=1643513 RepID=UPI0020A5ADA4|nr:hypothetical protein [Treponema sp. OMZ 857]UTC43581.1 hypothetical protein E4N66_05535 [Treponema sp. OMZ 857]